MGQMTEADRWFERCLRERGHEPGAHEPDLSGQGLTKCPEYVATSAAGSRAAFEVKAFSPKSKLGERFARQKSGAFDGKRLVVPIRNQFGVAAGQLKGLADEMPAVVVVSNPDGGYVNMTVGGVIEAMYGNLQYAGPIDPETGGPAGPWSLGLGRGGKLTNDHQYLSAVVILRRRELRDDALDALAAETKAQPHWETMSTVERADALADVITANEQDFPDGEYFHVDVIDTISAVTGDDWFTGPLDTRWRHDGVDRIEQVSGPAKPLRL